MILFSLVSCDRLDKSELQKLVDVEIVETEYTKESYTIYKQKYTDAKTVLEDTGTTQTKIDEAHEALESAINSLVRVANFKALEEALAVEYPENGYTKESYAEYREAYASALEVLENKNARQSTVNSALKLLKEKIDSLVTRPETGEIDQLLILNVEQSKYTSSTYNKYKQLCDAAKALKEKAITVETHNEVMDCKAEIQQCVAQLKDAIEKLALRGDKTALLDEYDAAFAHYNGRVDGVPSSVYYSTDTYEAFGAALTKAKEALDSDDMTQNHLDLITKELTNTREALEPSEIRRQFYNYIVSVQRDYIENSEYFTDETFEKLNSAVNAAIDEYTSYTSTEQTIELAITNIKNAISRLEYVIIVGTGKTDHDFSSHIFRVGTAIVNISEYFNKPGEFATLLIGPNNPDISSFKGSLETGLELYLDDGSVVIITRYKIVIKPYMSPIPDTPYDKIAIGGLDLSCSESQAIAALGGNPTEYYVTNSIGTLIYKDSANGYEVKVSYNMLVNGIDQIEMTYNPFV